MTSILCGIGFSLTLKESLDSALKNNPDIAAAQKRMQAAGARLGQAVGSFFPTIKFDGTLGRNYSQPSTMQITVQTTAGAVTQNYLLGVSDPGSTKTITTSLSQPIFMAALLPGLKMAQKSFDASKEDLRKISQDVIFNVTQSYYNVLKAEKMILLALQSKEMAQNHLKQVKSMVDAGTATRADLLRTEVQLANSEVALINAKNGYEIAQNTFNCAMGADIYRETKLEDISPGGHLGMVPDYSALLKMAFENRPDWKQYQLNIDIARENVGLARSGYFPSIILSGQTGSQIMEYPSYKSDSNSWSVTGVASWTLFDGLVTANKVREAGENLAAQISAETQLKNAIILDVRNNYLNLISLASTINLTKKSQESAEENYKVSEARYRLGAGTNIEVIDAQVALTQAKINYTQALFDLEIAKARLNKSIGKE